MLNSQKKGYIFKTILYVIEECPVQLKNPIDICLMVRILEISGHSLLLSYSISYFLF